MTDDNLKLFTSEDEIKSFCKVYGYDEGLTNVTIARWKSLTAEPLAVFKDTSKTITTTMEPDAIESKDETDLTE
jgi:hypothetical protein